MNIAGALSMTIFILTILTVIAALLSYLIFKARERSRKKAAPAPAAGLNLVYFTEYLLPGMEAEAAPVAAAPVAEPAAGGRGVLRYILVTAALVAVGGGSWYAYYYYRSHNPAPRAGVAKGVAKGTAKGTAKGPEPTRVTRAEPPDLRPVGSHAASLFPYGSLDANHDGKVQPAERAALHAKVPQFIVVTSDDNGSVEGLQWMRRAFSRRGFWGKVSFFLTGNYLSGRKNYLGGPVEKWWQIVLDESVIGLHGTTHASGADTWDVKRWSEEHSTVQGEIVKRLTLPKGWSWERYPWSSRAPFLMLTDAYFTALDQLKVKTVIDSSLVLHPGGPIMVPPKAGVPRDLHWPFTLDTPLPDTLDPPYLPSAKARAKIASHAVWEFPMYAWWVDPPKGKPSWQPSMDYNLWKLYGCSGDGPNEKIVEDLVANLKAHYEGNRVPFHLGLHADNYAAKGKCKRATIGALLQRIAAFADSHVGVKYISLPALLVWLKKMEKA